MKNLSLFEVVGYLGCAVVLFLITPTIFQVLLGLVIYLMGFF